MQMLVPNACEQKNQIYGNGFETKQQSEAGEILKRGLVKVSVPCI